MSKALILFRKLIKIILKSGEEIFVDAEKRSAIENLWQNRQIIKLIEQGRTIDSIMIAEIQEVGTLPDLSKIPEPYNSKIQARSKMFRTNINKDPSIEIILSWYSKLRNGESI